MNKVLDVVAPPRMGTGFRWLLSSSWVSNLGDGIAVAAGPLLVAAQTGDPLLVALAGLLQRLPWLLFGLHAGVIADRHDRRLIVIAVNGARAVVLAVLALSIATGAVSVAIVLAAMFLLGTAETFADITTGTLLPMIVAKPDLGVANAAHQRRPDHAQPARRATAGGVPVRGWDGLAVDRAGDHVRRRRGADVADGGRRRRAHGCAIARPRRDRGGRALVVAPPVDQNADPDVVFFNVTFGAAISVLVLYAERRLDAGPIAYGLLATASAVGGVIGSAAYPWLERNIGMANIIRAGLIIETLTHLTLANTQTLGSDGDLRRLRHPRGGVGYDGHDGSATRGADRVQGRIGGVYMVGLQGGLVVGAAVGGVLAQIWGVTAPFWFAFVGSAVILVMIWRQVEAHHSLIVWCQAPRVATGSAQIRWGDWHRSVSFQVVEHLVAGEDLGDAGDWFAVLADGGDELSILELDAVHRDVDTRHVDRLVAGP